MSSKSSQNMIYFQASPNPFCGIVNIEFALEDNAPVKLSVINSMGQTVALLFDGLQEKGIHFFSVQCESIRLTGGNLHSYLDRGYEGVLFEVGGELILINHHLQTGNC